MYEDASSSTDSDAASVHHVNVRKYGQVPLVIINVAANEARTAVGLWVLMAAPDKGVNTRNGCTA